MISKNAQGKIVLATEELKIRLKLEDNARIGTYNFHKSIKNMQLDQLTSAEVKVVKRTKTSGVTLQIPKKDGNIVIQNDMIWLMVKRNAQVKIVLATEASRIRLKVEKNAKSGTHNHHKSIKTMDILKITAEVGIRGFKVVMTKTSGVTLQIPKQDGNIVNHYLLQKKLQKKKLK